MNSARKELGLAVVNPRTTQVEQLEEIQVSIRQALAYFPPDKLFLNPDCGFGTFSNRPVNSAEIAFQKLKAIVEATLSVRGELA